MKQIGSQIGVNESRVSQLHARAIRRLRDALGQMRPQQLAEMRKALLAFASRKLVMANADATQIATAARKQGMKTLKEDGLEKVQAGWTSMEEVLRVTQDF